jgi:hypothetical protein
MINNFHLLTIKITKQQQYIFNLYLIFFFSVLSPLVIILILFFLNLLTRRNDCSGRTAFVAFQKPTLLRFGWFLSARMSFLQLLLIPPRSSFFCLVWEVGVVLGLV